MNPKVTSLALSSRVLVLVLQFVSNWLMPDHKPDVFKSPRNVSAAEPLDRIPKFLLGGLVRWDAEYFLHVSEFGYTYENTLAFYPLFPAVVKLITEGVLWLLPFLSFRYAALIVATAVNIYFFYRAANCLYDLTLRVLGDAVLAWNAVVLFCFNPASIFFSAPYSECLFSWLSFSLMLECATKMSALKVIATLALSFLCRSNGLLNIGFPIYFVFRTVLLKKTVFNIFKLVFMIALSLVPLALYHMYIYELFCLQRPTNHSTNIVDYAAKKQFVLAGPRSNGNSPWCDSALPYSYSYVQQTYWDVGLFNYYKLKQIPNFALAAPILVLISTKSISFLAQIAKELPYRGFAEVVRTTRSIPFVMHGLALTVFCTLFVHIQVSTRLLASSTPILYWFAAEYLPKSFEGLSFSLPHPKSMRALIIYWFGGYFAIGTFLFSNFYPWT